MNALLFLKRIQHNLEGITHLSPGACPGCPECGLADMPELPETEEQQYAYDCVGEPSFGTSDCDSCGSGLAGHRVVAHGFLVGTENEFLHLDICSDCAAYHANGEIPE